MKHDMSSLYCYYLQKQSTLEPEIILFVMLDNEELSLHM